jgi:hypothetical protein
MQSLVILMHISGRSIINIIDKQPTEVAKITMSEGLITAYLIPNIQVNMNISTTRRQVKIDFEMNEKVI